MLYNSLSKGTSNYTHFIDEETESYSGKLVVPNSYS